ncbi:MAG TPA: hypothetical protein VFI56_18455 [Vicinamibacterales bacterium]|nr:hypothetical protein [Vicinamibacterales bacterium]
MPRRLVVLSLLVVFTSSCGVASPPALIASEPQYATRIRHIFSPQIARHFHRTYELAESLPLLEEVERSRRSRAPWIAAKSTRHNPQPLIR